MLSQMRGWEWLIIVGLILLLFGAKRLPDTARGLGRSLRIFKAETQGLVGDKAESDATPEPAAAAGREVTEGSSAGTSTSSSSDPNN